MVSRTAADAQLSTRPLIGFAGAALAPQALVLALTIHLPRYYAGHIGLGLAAVGLAFTLVRLMDIGFDPLIGVVMDRTRTPFGRYRPWVIAGAPILMISSYMLFMAAPGVGEAYLVVWLLVFYAAISIVQLAQAAWAGVLAQGYNERSRIFSYIGAAGLLGSALVMLVPSFAARLVGEDDAQALHAMGWTMIALTPVLTLVAARTPETPRTATTGKPVTLREWVSIVWRPSMRRLVMADLALALGPGTLTPIFIFYWRDARGFTLPQANLMLVIFMLAGLVGAPVWGAIAQRIGKHAGVMITSACFAAGQLEIVSLPHRSPIVFPMMFVLGFFVAAFSFLVRAIVADVSDEVRLDHGRERSGLLFALVTSTQKIGGAVSVALTFWILAALGYNPAAGSANTAENLRGLEMVYALAPATFVMLGAACFIRFPLGAARHAEIRAALEAREQERSDEGADRLPVASPATARVAPGSR